MRKATYTTPNGTKYNLFCHILKQTHVLIAGASGSGKSVLVNGLLTTALYEMPGTQADGVQFILIDPKRTELSPYRATPHCIAYASEPGDMIAALEKAVDITETRYKEMERTGARTFSGGRIYVIIEELADLMTTNRRAVQPLIQRLCQIARAANVHVIAITQCPLAKVIPTEIKVNFDGIVALRTRSAQDSRNIIGQTGAELLPKYGECLYYSPDFMAVNRCTVPYVSEDEQRRLINHWASQRQAKEKKTVLPRFCFSIFS